MFQKVAILRDLQVFGQAYIRYNSIFLRYALANPTSYTIAPLHLLLFFSFHMRSDTGPVDARGRWLL